MRELTEQEKEAKAQAWQRYHLGDDQMMIADRRGFNFGFESGLDYQQAEIERLQKRIIDLESELDLWAKSEPTSWMFKNDPSH